MMKRLCKMLLAAAVLALCSAAWAAPVGTITGTNVNVRADRSTKARVLGRLSKPAEVEVLDVLGRGDDEWVKIKAKSGLTGWMSGKFVTIREAEEEEKTVLLVTGTNVNIRADHSTKARVVGRVSKPAEVQMLDAWDNGKEMWTKVRTQKGVVGWMSSQFLVASEGEKELMSASIKGTNVNVRADHSTKARIVGRLSKPAKVEILDGWGTGANEWFKVQAANGVTGWVSAQFVEPVFIDTPEGGDDPELPPEPAFETFTGVVTGINVNVRADHSTKAKALGRLSKPARVTVIDNWATGEQSWWKVRTSSGLVGWMSGEFVMNEEYLPPEQKQTPPPAPKKNDLPVLTPGVPKMPAPAVTLDPEFEKAYLAWLAGDDASCWDVFDKMIAEQSENPVAWLLRSVQLTSGKDVDHDPVRARKLELKALEMKSAYAQGCWSAVLPMVQDYARQGEARGAYLYGRFLWLDFSDEKAANEGMTWMRDAADKGYSEAQYQLGQAYAGWPPAAVKEDLNEAIDWYRRAAQQDHVPAMEELAKALEGDLGEGQEREGVTEDDLKEAFKWYTAAADNGSSNGQYGAALMLRDGKGTQKNLTTAAELFEAAAWQGHGPAAYETAVCCARGLGMEQSMEQAYKWMRVAEEIMEEFFHDSEEIFITGNEQNLAQAAKKHLSDDEIAAMDAEAQEIIEQTRQNRE